MSFTKFVPGVGNVEDIQEELNGMLFGNDSSQEVASSSTSPPTQSSSNFPAIRNVHLEYCTVRGDHPHEVIF